MPEMSLKSGEYWTGHFLAVQMRGVKGGESHRCDGLFRDPVSNAQCSHQLLCSFKGPLVSLLALYPPKTLARGLRYP